MFRVTRLIDFCYGHRLLNYDGKCKHLHGHNGQVVITLEAAELDERGMVLDFSDIKRVVSRWIDEKLDHQMILHRDDPAVPALKALGEPMFLLDVNPTAENIARLIFDYARGQGFPVTEVRLWETPNCYATFDAHGRQPDASDHQPDAHAIVTSLMRKRRKKEQRAIPLLAIRARGAMLLSNPPPGDHGADRGDECDVED